MFDPEELEEPIVQAPLAGGPSTPALAVAVCEAGGLGFLAAGYKQPDALREEIEQVRSATARPFGVNLFVPSEHPGDPASIRAYLEELAPEAARQGAELGEPRFDDDGWEPKLEIVREQRPAVVSFTFGCPPADVVQSLHECDVAVWVTITTPKEAEQASQVGADALVVQGIEAGGHRGGFADVDGSEGWGLLALLRVVANSVDKPLIGAGGIADGAAVAAVLCAGASAAQIGTALMLSPEAATVDAQRELLGRPIPTGLTRAFSGRTARGLVNRFLEEHSAAAPAAYPEIHHATSPLRAAARRQGDADAFNLWAGQAHRLARELPAGEIVATLATDARSIIRRLAGN
ncbi:MAG TPA: nitronate monooxygenase [Solirubrobacteraceae bacterium]|nr:nitronate monooxygenase [Solirubrobacteraceae bacterium]